jgi:aspartate/methionine/tyrosine aminotransferase
MPPRRTLLAIATLLRRGLSSGVGGVGAVVESKLTLDNINPAVLVTQYAVRGELVQRASAIQESNFAEKPYRKLLECNIGNPQAVGQSPLTFNRQVLSLLCYPELARNPAAAALFEPDAILRAKEYLQAIPNGLGAYSESQGFAIVRQQVANFITKRDAGVPAYKENIFLTDGASKGVEKMLSLILRGRTDGVLVPIPQYPLYSATLALAEAHLLGYELVEEEGWRLSVDVLEEKLAAAKANGIHTRGLVVINPGNPTGNSLPLENMKEVLRFCGKHGLILMADEVYQENVWLESRPFHSFKKVLHTMADAPKVQLVSFHSTSKGFLGECGMRGGYFELCNFDPEVLPPRPIQRFARPPRTRSSPTTAPIVHWRAPVQQPPPHARSPTHTPPRHPHATHTPPTRHPGLRRKPRAGGPAAAQARLHWAVLQHARPDRDRLDGPTARARGAILRTVQR